MKRLDPICRFQCLLDYYDLGQYWQYYGLYNKAYHAPYHNYFHTQCVMLYVLDYLEASNLSDIVMVRNALISAMFHDFNHTMGVSPDSVNINNAVTGILGLGMSEIDYNCVVATIRCTEYSEGSFKYQPNNLVQQALRDADISTIFLLADDYSKDLIYNQYRGLYEEINTTLYTKKLPLIPWFDFVAGQTKFFESATFYTELGKQRQKKLLPECLSNLTDLLREVL